ncbi:sialidase family protein [Dyadobacter arcticus]|uniref:Neuraminidase n=1 Tax=Dyadobacter arcticus TaxID=1078754 RepID=A0ABX0UE46_9BACT|nr:sialidase family protein [Dyadobacter arcticus]NIJ51274.1 putative neuraminidase [Dyadobacter arcticus]
MRKLIVTLVISLGFRVVLFGQQAAVVREMLIFPHQEKHVHGSSIVSLPNGDFLTAWFQGSGERTEDDVRIMGARLVKGSNKWSEPFLMADTPNIPDCNPVLFLNAQGKLFLVWIAVQANLWEQSILRFRTSTDYGKNGPPVWNWQDNILLKPNKRFAEEVAKKFKDLPEYTAGWAGYAAKYDEMIIEASKDAPKRSIGWMTRIKPLLLENGRIVLPLYSDGYNFSMTAISEDNGDTWRPGLPIVGRGPIQPAIVKKKNGTLVAYMRDSGDEPTRVHISESSDNGETWKATQKLDLPNTASVELLVLKDGRWAFLGNDIDDGRYQLRLMLSDDDGNTWKWKTYIEDDKTKKGGYSYPSLIQTDDGLLHMTYSHHPEKGKKSIKYVVVDPNK